MQKIVLNIIIRNFITDFAFQMSIINKFSDRNHYFVSL